MRIGITCYPTYCGSGAVATELGLELARRGHEVHFISYASPFRLRGGFAERVTFHEVVTADYPLFEHSRWIPSLVSAAGYFPRRVGAGRRALAPPDRRPLTHVSTSRPVKRVRDGVRFFAGVRKAPPATLVLIGDGPDRDAAEQETDR